MIGYIYKIIHNQSDIKYIGSTTQKICQRWQNHKTSYNLYLNNKSKKNISIYKYFEQYDIKNFSIILIKEYEICDKRHLEAYEQLWINKFKCININSSFSPLRFNKNLINSKRNENKDIYNKQKKQYYINNKEQFKQYKIDNKKHIKEYNKNYNIRVLCECGIEYSKSHAALHKKSKKHLSFFN